MFSAFLLILKRDLLLAMRRRSEIFTVLFFFIVVISLFPLGISTEDQLLKQIAPGVVWVAALLASTLALDRLFSDDYEDGTLEQMTLAPVSLPIVVLAKIIAHWLLTGLPLVLISPLVGLFYHLPFESIKVMMLVLLLGTPVLSMLGAIAAALTLGLRGGGVLISLLVLPLYIPVLVYGAGAISTSMVEGLSIQPYVLLLSAFMLLAFIFSPWATAAAIKISIE
ncbi:heme exporter protein CcmB [Cocleimonas sp. KMM 6892]|uniref:heme exporter protein CcmB n=1 Tax=unclassified Cocleimonas TaxID=2639732 RepID=UPI002DBE6581|nr:MULTISPECIES: heme exporter protein CcmB [unclassified Cocleimonas]MEB8432484.1 heme exporter protein CcmB [Cocleimonas sp. KMM 6892]MEC4715343.1 heme exporter protein CcmB [Cocleimonas sp. KMM 6895]MEC4745038.1 heme exporter protein CcmB [Cocleimonas sp. KMM 6896]